MADSSSAKFDSSYDIPESPYCHAMQNLLGKTIKCTLDDGRTATGSLVCVDRLYVLCLSCKLGVLHSAD